MTNEEVIAILCKENLELKEEVKSFSLALKSINGILFCVGGPLNDNIYKYNKEQLKTFWRIKELIAPLLPIEF